MSLARATVDLIPGRQISLVSMTVLRLSTHYLGA